MASIQKISPFLWYDHQAESAAEFYVSVFPQSSIISKGPLVTEFELTGIRFQALNGGPQFTFNEAISFAIYCDNQQEVDFYWNKLTADGGEESMCGWLKDKFGLWWQVVPTVLINLYKKGEAQKTANMMQAMMGMRKMIIADLESAYNA